MMTPSQIYIVMQMDSFIKFFAYFGFATLIATIAILLAIASERYVFQDDARITPPIRWLAVPLISLLVATLLPSTKTTAAMFILPKIVNNENVQKEAPEIYEIAKKALKDISGEK